MSLELLAIILLLLWALGFFGFPATVGGLIHFLLVLVLVVLIVRIAQGRRVL